MSDSLNFELRTDETYRVTDGENNAPRSCQPSDHRSPTQAVSLIRFDLARCADEVYYRHQDPLDTVHVSETKVKNNVDRFVKAHTLAVRRS